jgi:CO/xanthine dehydrogenase FAD-binding subunit
MRAALSSLAVVRPRNLDHALELLSDLEDRATPLAGGTDLFVYLNAGTLESKRFVDLWRLDELRGIRVHGDRVELGALTTFSEIREHEVIRRRFPALVAAAAEVGARQIQNRATVGGNIANASPAGDSLPVLLALDAIVHARSTRGARQIPFAELYRGYRQLALDRGELITSVVLPLPLPLPRSFQFFRKVGTRRAQSISKVVMCGVLRQDRRGVSNHVRLAYGSVAPVPVRARHAEDALWNSPASAEAAARARTTLLDDISPIDDIRSDREYRLTVAANLLTQFLRAADPRFTR